MTIKLLALSLLVLSGCASGPAFCEKDDEASSIQCSEYMRQQRIDRMMDRPGRIR